MMDWQPIETAPKDGATILVWERILAVMNGEGEAIRRQARLIDRLNRAIGAAKGGA